MRAPDAVLAQALSNRILELTLMPTEACNFRCTYCYEDFALGRMGPEVVRGVKSLLTARAPDLDSLHLAWFGGEPLLALDVVLDIQEHAQELQRANPAMRCGANMTTNAWRLSPEVFERLVRLGVSGYQISLDGPAELHDKKRRRANGKPTFARIWGHLLAMRGFALDFLTTLRLHVDRENLATLHLLVDRIRAAFGDDPRFEIFLKPLSRYGGPNDAELPVLEGTQDARRYAELRRYVYGDPSLQHGSAAGRGASPPTCYAARGNSHVVRADGRLCKCTVALDHPSNEVGRLHADGTVTIDPGRASPWMRGLSSGDPAELACPLLGLSADAGSRDGSTPGPRTGVEPRDPVQELSR